MALTSQSTLEAIMNAEMNLSSEGTGEDRENGMSSRKGDLVGRFSADGSG